MADNRHVDVGAVALHGLIVEQLVAQPHGGTGQTTGTAGTRDALTAVAELARAIEEPAEAGDLHPDQAHRMMSLLLVVRDAIEPLGPETPEKVRRYVAEVVDKLHH